MGKGGKTFMNLSQMALVGAGGAFGAVIRYGVGQWFLRRGALPIYATLSVNLAGSFAMGILVGNRLMEQNPDLYALLGTGILGGLTTYSTLNVQKASLAGEGTSRRLAQYIGATYIGGWTFTAAGIWLGGAVFLST
jgi:CrcB protein